MFQANQAQRADLSVVITHQVFVVEYRSCLVSGKSGELTSQFQNTSHTMRYAEVAGASSFVRLPQGLYTRQGSELTLIGALT